MAINYLQRLLLWLGILGTGIYLVGLLGWLKVWIIIPLSLPVIGYSVQYVKNSFTHFSRMGRGEKLIIVGLISQFILYSLGLFVPETSFDAVWYHIPLAEVYASTGRIAQIPELLYSTMPRLGEMYFVLGFLLHSPLIIKFISLLFSLLFSLLTYHLSRQYLTRFWSLLTTLVVNSLYVIAWQSTAGYVDLTRAVFELAALLSLIVLFSSKLQNLKSLIHGIFISSLFTGFALSVKFQAVIFFIALLVFLILSLKRIGYSLFKILILVTCYLLLSFAVASPWYIDNYRSTGHAFYPLNLPAKQLDQLTHAGAVSSLDWLSSQTIHLPLLFWDLSVNPAQQLTPLILILLPFLFNKKIIRVHLALYAFILVFLILWWFLPPPESRYALSVIPPLIALEFLAATSLPARYHYLKRWTIIFALITVGLNYSLRLAASAKFVPLLTGHITSQQYIDSQTTDFNRDIMQKYYSGYWQNYRYPTE